MARRNYFVKDLQNEAIQFAYKVEAGRIREQKERGNTKSMFENDFEN